MAKAQEPQDPNAAPKGVSDEEWVAAQQQAAQQGVRPEDIIAKGKDPLYGLGVTEAPDEKEKK